MKFNSNYITIIIYRAVLTKESHQRCGFFRVLKRINKLIYELELPIVWKLHPVVSVVQLERLFFGNDPYHRFKFNHIPAVEIENDIPTYQSYKIGKLVGKRVRKYNKTNVVQYLMK